jgi:hypothetical protein
MKTFDALDAAAKSAHEEGTYAFVPIARAKMLVDAGQYDAAIAAATQGLERATKPGLPGATVNGVRRAGLTNRMLAEARSGKLDAAAATLAKLEAEAKATPTNAFLASNVSSDGVSWRSRAVTRSRRPPHSPNASRRTPMRSGDGPRLASRPATRPARSSSATRCCARIGETVSISTSARRWPMASR